MFQHIILKSTFLQLLFRDIRKWVRNFLCRFILLIFLIPSLMNSKLKLKFCLSIYAWTQCSKQLWSMLGKWQSKLFFKCCWPLLYIFSLIKVPISQGNYWKFSIFIPINWYKGWKVHMKYKIQYDTVQNLYNCFVFCCFFSFENYLVAGTRIHIS